MSTSTYAGIPEEDTHVAAALQTPVVSSPTWS